MYVKKNLKIQSSIYDIYYSVCFVFLLVPSITRIQEKNSPDESYG